MSNRVRDLDLIQERDEDDRGRRIGTILMATASIVGLTFAVGVLVGRAAEPSAPSDDPLSKLEHRTATTEHKPAPSGEPALPKVDAADMSFPTTLSEVEERPEVLEALKAAAAEAADLAKVEPVAAVKAADRPTPSAVQPARIAAAKAEQDAAAEEAAGGARLGASIPAAVAAGTGSRGLPQALKHDKLVAAAMHTDPDLPSAPHGHDGEFTLQVISYDRPEPSRAFAESLRKKGHAAFVTAADVADRGRYYRVRIGPFKGREQAENYRRKFEDVEHMNTFVVRNQHDET